MGKVWKVVRFDSKGRSLGTEYELEASVKNGSGPLLLDKGEIEDLIGAVRLALDYMDKVKDEASDVSFSLPANAAV